MSGQECGDPQSDDVVESTTSRPLQTVGTNWEPDPRERKLEVGASPKVPYTVGKQGGGEQVTIIPHTPSPVQPHLGGTSPPAKESQQPRELPP